MVTAKKTSIFVGVLFIVGTLSGILSVVLTKSLLENGDYLVEIAAHGTQVIIGSIFIVIMGISLSMVPVLLFPLLKKQNEVLAIGALVFRGVLEAVMYVIIAVKMLFLYSISQRYIQALPPESLYLKSLADLLQAADIYLMSLLGIIFSIGALMIYFLLYQSKLIPRWLSAWGLLGGIPYFVASLSGMFGLEIEVFLLPLAVQEMIMALWLIVKGFDENAITSLSVCQ